jgi:hypothetical protein
MAYGSINGGVASNYIVPGSVPAGQRRVRVHSFAWISQALF